MTQTSVLPEVEQLARSVGEFIQYWGFKRIHGQIWTHLYLSTEPIDAGELIKRLGVSKALISMSLAELANYDVISECGKGPKNTLIYTANKDITKVITNVLRRRERQMLSQVDAACRLVSDLNQQDKDSMQIDTQQVKKLTEIVSHAQMGLSAILSLSDVDMSFWSQLAMSQPLVEAEEVN